MSCHSCIIHAFEIKKNCILLYALEVGVHKWPPPKIFIKYQTSLFKYFLCTENLKKIDLKKDEIPGTHK